MVRYLALIILGAIVITLLVGSTALAADAVSWETIHSDLMDNGRLDGTYTEADLDNYLNNATVAEYFDVVRDRINQLKQTDSDRDTFPFTGFQLMIAGIVAVVLVGGGIALRHFSRPQSS